MEFYIDYLDWVHGFMSRLKQVWMLKDNHAVLTKFHYLWNFEIESYG